MRTYYTYILTNYTNSALYVGFSNSIVRRMYEHKNHLVYGHSDKYNCTKLVYYEEYADANKAIRREKIIKGKLRSKKIALVNSKNPHWIDLSKDWGIPILSPKEREIQKQNLKKFNKAKR